MDLKLPHLGEGADSGTIVNVFVKVGDTLAKDQPLIELESEKAVATIPASAAGTVTEVYVKSGDKISVGHRIVAIAESGAAAAAPAASKPASRSKPAAAAPREPVIVQEPSPEPVYYNPDAGPQIEPAASPSIRRLAHDLGLDLTRIRGSARGGRILMEDVRAYLQYLQRLGASRAPAPQPAPAQAAPRPVESIDFSKWGPITRKPMTSLRQIISRRMVENWNAIPHVTQFDDVDITNLNALRKKYAEAYEKQGVRLTLTSFVLMTVARTLKKHPIFNSSIDESSNEIVLKDYVHIGIAVDTESGLIVPVIRDADQKDLVQLSRDLEDLAKKARDRKVTPDELKGGTFTISNQGGIGGAHFTPIVNKPEVAILGLGRGALKAVVRGEKIEPRMMMPIGLSYDHRIIDGGVAARFTVDLVQAFENFKEEDVKI
jgi:pyruvate dehydrogenase E2 component (dihydrolipoamide acetyltransferase)